VTSDSGQKLAGGTVSLKGEGQTISTSVFTDEQGNYYLPPTLAEGKYQVWAQAEGYQTRRTAAAFRSGLRHQDFVLKPMKDFVKQLTGQEYIAALPEDTPQHRRMKDAFINNCTGCHEASYILQNRFDEAGWGAIIELMSKMINGGGNYGGADEAPFPVINYYKKDIATYLAEMRGPGPSPMQIKAHERPMGEAARAVITEYAIPITDTNTYSTDDGYTSHDGSDWSLGTPSRLNGTGGPHDAQMDFNGNIWFTYAQPSYVRSLGMVDTKTGKVIDLKVPGIQGRAAFTHGITIDRKGILWFTAAGAASLDGGVGSLARLDPNTRKVDVFTPPTGMSGVTLSVDEDGKGNIWASTATGAVRFDPNTHEFTEFRSVTQTDAQGLGPSYGVTGDREGNGWWTQMYIDRVGKGDVTSKKSIEVEIPPQTPLSADAITPEDRQVYSTAGVFMSDFSGLTSQGPRRMGADKNGDTVWVCDYWGGNLSKIDIHSLKTTLYAYPAPKPGTYDAVVDSHHNVWVNLFNSDAIAKFDPAKEEWTEYPLPTRGTEMRHIAIADRNGSTEVIMTYFRAGKVARLQFRSKEELQALRTQVQESEVRAQK
jgi:streptogramin lyase